MSSVLVQFRTEDTAKAKATSICDRLGLDLQSYLRMCISRMNQENGIPFSMNVNDLPKIDKESSKSGALKMGALG